MIKFELTQEIQEQLAAHNKWLHDYRSGNVYAEPVNVWPDAIDQMIEASRGITLGWGSKEEIAIDFLHAPDNNEFYDHARAYYKTGALDTQELVDRWESFKVLRPYASL